MLKAFRIHVHRIYQLILALSILQETLATSYPCKYADTVNITEGLRLKDGSYSFAGLVIPSNLTAEYMIKVIDGIEYGADRHMRGCICLLKPCITFCCPMDMFFDEFQQNCTKRRIPHNPLFDSEFNSINDSNHQNRNYQYGHIEVTHPNGSIHIVSITETFVVRYELGCKHKRIDRNDVEFWKWDLYANGSLMRDGKLWTTDEYCFTPMEHKKVWSLTPLTCVRHQRGVGVWIYVICLALAIIINAFNAAFLVSIHSVRNNSYGEILIFYLISIVIGDSALAYLSLKNPMNLSENICRSIGFIAYYFIMLSFLLLNFISWEFWRKFIFRPWYSWKRKFIYAFIILLAFALKYGVKFAQDSDYLPKNLKPGIGDSVCWFDVRLLGILLFYYLPILLSLSLSVFCCFKAYIAIWHLTPDKTDSLTVDIKLTKSHFYSFVAYLIGVISITLREILVWISARLREHFFIIDLWTGICVLGLAITGCICFLWKNRLVKIWWRQNVSNKSDDLNGISSTINSNREFEFETEQNRQDNGEQIALK